MILIGLISILSVGVSTEEHRSSKKIETSVSASNFPIQSKDEIQKSGKSNVTDFCNLRVFSLNFVMYISEK